MLFPAQWIAKHGINIICPFNPKLINPASYDVTLSGEVLLFHARAKLGLESPMKVPLPHVFNNGDFIIASTVERFCFANDVAGELRLKSTVARKGLTHCLAVFFDPGFIGQATLELQVVGPPIELRPGMPIMQMLFYRLSEPTELSYGDTGRYMNQSGPTVARPERIDKKTWIQ